MSWDDIPEEGSTGVRPMTDVRGVVAGFALLMGIGSILMSFFPIAHFSFIVYHYAFIHDPRAPQGGSWVSLLFYVTKPWPLTIALGWLTVAWCLGYAGYRIAMARREPGRLASLASAAVRFSAWGLVGCGLDVAIIAGMLAYRLNRWYFG
jgi:hypothetical protein